MDLREYTYITRAPDTFPKSTLENIKKMLFDINSQYLSLIDKIFDNGYITPPKDYKWHGCYRIILSVQEKQLILQELERALNSSLYDETSIASVKQFHSYWKRCINEKPIPYEKAIKTQQYYDLRNISLKQFEDFIFNHPMPENTEQYWYNDIDMWIDYEKEDVIKLYIQMFHHSNELLKLYSEEQLEQGFWVMMGFSLADNWTINGLVWANSISIEKRIELIYAMYELFKNLFNNNSLDTSCHMWWDALAYDFHPMKRRSRENETERQIQDAMFNTLKSILELSSEKCRISALHGLGHLQHPETETIIKTHLKINKMANGEYCDYANACITGDIL
ncbi:hypothetical protein BROC_00696 [Candidatus Brocadiaceae bacterium]|nr:hypothetical protein BROC_00696 [Candidatus Brocadiaceae bacterium]